MPRAAAAVVSTVNRVLPRTVDVSTRVYTVRFIPPGHDQARVPRSAVVKVWRIQTLN